jgi:hypothetical protein
LARVKRQPVPPRSSDLNVRTLLGPGPRLAVAAPTLACRNPAQRHSGLLFVWVNIETLPSIRADSPPVPKEKDGAEEIRGYAEPVEPALIPIWPKAAQRQASGGFHQQVSGRAVRHRLADVEASPIASSAGESIANPGDSGSA